MKEKPTKAKKKGRTIRAFKREERHLALAFLCSGRDPDIHLQLHSDVWCTDRVPPLQCDGRNH